MLDFLTRAFLRRSLPPVSRALDVEPGSRIESQMRDAIAAIDAVHTDGTLPRLPVTTASLTDQHGYFGSTMAGNALEIVLNLFSPHVELTTVHEIGHFLDLKALHPNVTWASENSPTLAPWREAVKRSQAVQTLRHFSDPAVSTIKVTHGNGFVVEYLVDKAYTAYLLRAKELWARSYTQFIATESRQPALVQQVEAERERPESGIYYPKHWDEADFSPIRTEIITLLRDLRWRP